MEIYPGMMGHFTRQSVSHSIVKRNGVKMLFSTTSGFNLQPNKPVMLGRFIGSFDAMNMDSDAIKRMIRKMRRKNPELKGKRLEYSLNYDPFPLRLPASKDFPGLPETRLCYVYIPKSVMEEFRRFKKE